MDPSTGKDGGESGAPRLHGAGSARFHTTQWSQILAARQLSSPEGGAAMAELYRTYWYPLYAYTRGCGFSADDSQDLVQAFFARLMESDFLSAADPERGRFRWFLLKSLRNFLRNDIARMQALKRGGGHLHISWDSLEAESRFQAEPVDDASPDKLFDRSWARAAMGRAFERLAEEFAATGRSGLFHHLKKYLAAAAAGSAYREIASQLGLSPVAVKVSVHRLRARYRELIRSEVARTVADPTDIEDELRHLVSLLAG